MPTLQPLSRSAFGRLRWKRYGDYRFTASDALCPLVAHELSKAALALPIAFVPQGQTYTPAAVQGLASGQNLYVHPDGRWLTTYIPAAYRSHPFRMAQTPDGQEVLCVDTDSGLISETEGDAFFTDSGEPSPELVKVIDFFQQIAANRQATQAACGVLQSHGLIQPWPIMLKGEQGDKTVQGLYRIDEARLNALSAPALKEIQAAGALAMAYSQLLSMQHLPTLGQLAALHAQAQSQQTLPTSANGELDLEFLNNNGTLSFGNL